MKLEDEVRELHDMIEDLENSRAELEYQISQLSSNKAYNDNSVSSSNKKIKSPTKIESKIPRAGQNSNNKGKVQQTLFSEKEQEEDNIGGPYQNEPEMDEDEQNEQNFEIMLPKKPNQEEEEVPIMDDEDPEDYSLVF
jgi:hypothetical protein